MSEFSSPDIVEMMLAEWVFDQYFNMTKCYYLHTVSDGYIYTYLQSISVSKLTCYGQAHKY